jgi:hypothetical protein
MYRQPATVHAWRAGTCRPALFVVCQHHVCRSALVPHAGVDDFLNKTPSSSYGGIRRQTLLKSAARMKILTGFAPLLRATFSANLMHADHTVFFHQNFGCFHLFSFSGLILASQAVQLQRNFSLGKS